MRKITIIVMGLCALLLLGVEIPALINDEINDTISEIMWQVGSDYPILVLFIGI